MELRILSRSSVETEAIGETLGKIIKPPFVISLYGELGAGKTTFVRGIARGLGIDKVRSPTFTLINRYDGKHVLYHVDLYRIQDEEEVFHLGLMDIIDDPSAIVVIEWADRGFSYLPDERLDVSFEFSRSSPDERWIYFKPFGERALEIAEMLG